MNENCCLCICFTELYFFYGLSVVSLAILIAVPFVFSRSWTSLAGVLKTPRGQTLLKIAHRYKTTTKNKLLIKLKHNSINVHSNTPQLATGWPYRWFWKSFKRFRWGHGCFDRPEYWTSAICLSNDCEILVSEVCMIKRAPHSTVSPQMWCIKSMIGWFTRPQQILQSKLVELKKFGLICLPRICFPCLISCDQEPLWLLINVMEDDCYFLGVHIRLSTRCKIWFTLGLFENYFRLN